MNFDLPEFNNIIFFLTAWGAAFVSALWLSLILWTWRDIRVRSRDNMIRILAVVVVALLFLPGVIIYLILRPQRSMDEEYQQSLEEEALLQAIEDSQLCPGCGRKVKESWIVCPSCHTKLKKNCHECGKLMELPWNLCPYCGTPAPGMRRDNLSIDESFQPIEVEEEPLE
jgi:RNA polymerase subunit RPABC4/transcription elongation factor Spt4